MTSNSPAASEPAARWMGWRFVAAVTFSPACLLLALALWWVSDRLVYVGPLDRATSGWAVVARVIEVSP